ncbi:MAG: Ig-like domain-containing domain, partial [Ruminiclostridium sp.]
MVNFKKISAVVVALAIMVTTLVPAFAAADTTVNRDKAVVLNKLELYAGTSTSSFVPSLETKLTRGQGAILIAKLFNMDDAALALTDADADAILKDFADASKVPTYAKKRLAYLVQANIMSGSLDAGKLYINADESLLGGQFATLLLKQMGFTVAAWTEAVAQLSNVEGSKDVAAYISYATNKLLRDQAVGIMYGSLTAKYADGSATIIEKIVAAKPALKAIAQEAGLIEAPNTTLEVDSVISVANNKVKVELKDAAEATAADFAIVKKGTTTAVAVKNVAKESDKIYVLETEALVAGTTYTLTANAKSVNFTGIKADTTVPTVVKVTGTDSNKFTVEYSDKMDFATGTDIANYTFDKSIKVLKAEINSDRNKIILFTDAAKQNIVYTLTIQNVANSDGKAISKTSRTVTASEDKTAPKLTALKVQNNRMLVLTIADNSGIDKTAAETLSNYSINDLEVLSAKAYDIDDDADDDLETVVLTTSEQTASKSYTLTIENVVDAAVLANPISKTTRTFRGATADKTAPTVSAVTVKSDNNNKVIVEFNEANALDVTSLEDISNYAITYGSNGDTLEVISAKAAYTTFPDAYNKATKKVTLTTAAQEINRQYKLEVKGVQDEFGNALKPKSGSTSYTTYPFTGSIVDVIPPTVTKVEYISDTRVNLTFSENLDESTAEDPTNYSLDNDIGAPTKANLTSDKIVELTTPALSNNKTYKVTTNNVEDTNGNASQNVTSKFVATSKDLDTTTPSINYIQASSKTEILVNFDETVTKYPSSITVDQYNDNVSPNTWKNVPITFTALGRMDDGKTVVYHSTPSTAQLVTYTSYKIATTTGNFADDAGNAVVFTIAANPIADRTSFEAAAIDNVVPTVDYTEQINAKKIKVVFTEPVLVGENTVAIDNDFKNGFKQINKDDDDDYFSTEWYYVTGSKIPTDKDTDIFDTVAFDTNGTSVVNDKSAISYKFRGYLEDSTKPSIASVIPDNDHKIIVTYDEDLALPGSYKILKLNTSTGKKDLFETKPGTCDSEDNTVEIALTNKLSSADTYYLVVVSGGTDIAGNKEDSSSTEYEFSGSDVSVSNFVTGVSIIKANQIKVTATTNMISAIVKTEVATTGAISTTTAAISALKTGNADNFTVD